MHIMHHMHTIQNTYTMNNMHILYNLHIAEKAQYHNTTIHEQQLTPATKLMQLWYAKLSWLYNGERHLLSNKFRRFHSRTEQIILIITTPRARSMFIQFMSGFCFYFKNKISLLGFIFNTNDQRQNYSKPISTSHCTSNKCWILPELTIRIKTAYRYKSLHSY